LTATIDPERAMAILVPRHDRVELAEFDLTDSTIVAYSAIELAADEGNTRVLMERKPIAPWTGASEAAARRRKRSRWRRRQRRSTRAKVTQLVATHEPARTR
jgi:hypothetical protein